MIAFAKVAATFLAEMILVETINVATSN